MRRKGQFRHVLGIWLCAVLTAGSMGAAVFPEEISSETAIAMEDSDLGGSQALVSPGKQEDPSFAEEMPDAITLEEGMELEPGDAALDEGSEGNWEEAAVDENQEEIPAGLIEDEEPEELSMESQEELPGEAAILDETDDKSVDADKADKAGDAGEADDAEEPHGITYPTARKLTYTGEVQELLDTSAVPEGTLFYYSLDGETYDRQVPAGTDAGEYIVYVKAADGEESQALERIATIEKAEVVFIPPVAAK